ncbi:hypothetical protein FXN61_46675 [Lentzea sp. PSKA42]|uniref:Proteins of 100 residues with WXG n=1 Tax=Lentzea indica TaxID=2604800 RepID=A0ABX1FZ95_9PSEU|nr:hypothetical protein [Lentzea indica]NKE63796.1 hypothetical protein [Lentzea indica]
MKITEENKLKGSLFIEAYGSLIDGIGKDAESETEKALDITFNAIGAASATVMLAIDPLGSLIGAGIGWLIEHVSFLRDALNQLMGNPEEIQANVEANKARAAELRVLAEDHKNGLATFDGWTGASSEAFKKSMDGMAQELDELASAVETKAKVVAVMGMLVTVLRDIVRDLIAQLLGSLIGGALLAAAAMIPTFGASIPAFIGFAVGKAVALGTNIASRVARVVAALGRQMKRIGDLDDIMAKISKGWERFENVADVAEVTYEGVKAAKDVDKKIDEAVKNNQAGGGQGGGGGAPTGEATLANARVGTVQMESAQATAATRMSVASEPLARTQMEAAEPMQALRRTEAAEPMQAAQAVRLTEAAEPMQALRRMDAVGPMQAATRMEAAEPMQAVRRMDVAEPMQPMHRMSAVEAPMAFSRTEATPMHEAVARTASDSTMVSGVSMTSGTGTPVHQAVQPLEMYSSADTPSEPLQQASGYEPLARTQMSHAYEALEPMQPREAYVEAEPAYEAVNPLMASEPLRPTVAYEAGGQAGGSAAQPLRPTVAHERLARPTE